MQSKKLLAVLLGLSLVVLPSFVSSNHGIIPSASAAEMLYGTDSVNLFSVDPSTAAVTTMGPIGFQAVGLSFDNTGTLFGADDYFVKINTSTGAGTSQFANAEAFAGGCTGGLAFDNTLTLPNTDSTRLICTVINNGGFQTLVTFESPRGDGQSIDVRLAAPLDPSDFPDYGGTAVDSNHNTYFADNFALYEIIPHGTNPSTLNLMNHLDFSSISDTNCDVTSLSFNSANSLYAAVTCTNNHYLATIDIGTGAVHPIGSVPGLQSIAFMPPLPWADFALASSDASVQAGSSGTSTVTITPLNGYLGPTTLSFSGAPSGVTITPTSAPNGQSTLAIAVGSNVAPGTYTVTVTGTSGSLSHSTTFTLTVASSAGIVILGTSDVHLEQHTTITSGNVILQNKGQVHIGEGSTLASSSVIGDTIHLEKNVIVGTANYNKLQLDNGASVGTKVSPLSIPVVVSLPPFPSSFTVGSADIHLKSGSQTITPGDYNNIAGDKGVTLEFTGGTYNIHSLSVGDSATLKFDSPSIVNVKDAVELGQNSVLNPTLPADKILFYAGAHIHVGQSSTVNANMYAPNDEIHLEQKSVDTGAFLAQRVHIEQGSTVTSDYGFPPGSPSTGSTITSTHGHGSVGSNTRFEFDVKSDKNNNLHGKLQFTSSSSHIRLESISVLSLTLNPDGSATFTGGAKVNGASGYTYSVTVQDRADNSHNPDIFDIQIFNGSPTPTYSNPGPVTVGDVEVETSKGH